MSALEELRKMNIEAQKRNGATTSRASGSPSDGDDSADSDDEDSLDNGYEASREPAGRLRSGSVASSTPSNPPSPTSIAGTRPGNRIISKAKGSDQNETLELIPVVPRPSKVQETKSFTPSSSRGSSDTGVNNRGSEGGSGKSSRVIYPDSQIDSYLDRQIDSYPDSQIDDDHAINGEGDILTDPAEINQLRRDLNAARKTATKNVNFKMPTALNDALAAYIAENWKSRPQKQDIIAYGIQLALMRLRTGGALTDLDDEDFSL